MQLCRMWSQDQGRASTLPIGFPQSLHQIARRADRVVQPSPVLSGVDVEAHKGILEIERLEIQGDAPLIERGMIGGRRPSRLPLLLAAPFPVRTVRQIGADFANRVLDD